MSQRGRKCKEISYISKYFLTKFSKRLSPQKFGDDKARAFARSLLEYDLFCIPNEIKTKFESLKKLKYNEKLQSQEKSKIIIILISNHPQLWDDVMFEFKNSEHWMNKLEIILRIRYPGEDSNKEFIFGFLLELIIKYLKIKGDKLIKKSISGCQSDHGSMAVEDTELIIKKEPTNETNVIENHDDQLNYELRSIEDFFCQSDCELKLIEGYEDQSDDEFLIKSYHPIKKHCSEYKKHKLNQNQKNYFSRTSTPRYHSKIKIFINRKY